MAEMYCPHCDRMVEVGENFQCQGGYCPLCGQFIAAVKPAVAPPRWSGWAIASLVFGLLGCTGVGAILAIILGLAGIRQVNRSGGAVKGIGLAVAGMVIGGLGGIALLIMIPVTEGISLSHGSWVCANNLKNIGQAIKSYTYQNRGQWPTVYTSPEGDTDRHQSQTWGGPQAWDAKFNLRDRGAKEDLALQDRPPFTCNLSCWWLLVRDGLIKQTLFICLHTDQKADKTDDPGHWWSFTNLDNVSYSFQNQLGRNTRDHDNEEMVVAADRSPLRDDITDRPKGRRVPANRWEWNSPNHRFKGQNVLYVDTRVEFKASPNCGIGGNNIWLRSTRDAATGKWTDDEKSYNDKASTVGDPNDSFLVP